MFGSKKMGLFLTFLISLLNVLVMTFVVLPLLFVILVPLAVYRFSFKILAKVFRPDLLSMVRCRDSVFANDRFDIKPNSTILLVDYLLNCNPDLETIRTKIYKNIFDNSSKLSFEQKFPMLLQHFERWCGFMFTKWETDFNICDHVKEWKKPDSSIVLPEDLCDIRRKFLVEPYKSKTSAWEIILVRNYQETPDKEKGSLIISKFHHSVMDGFSLVKFLLKSSANVSESEIKSIVPQSISKPLTLLQTVGIFSKLFLETPSIVLSQVPNLDAANIFHPNHVQTKTKLTGKRYPLSTTIPVEIIKNAARHTGTSFTSIIMEGLTGGIRNYLIAKGKDVPNTIDVTIPLPWPGHPGQGKKFRNHFTFAVLEIPTSMPNHEQRLKNLHQQFINLKKSSVPALNYVTTFIVGMLPNPIMSYVLKSTPCSILFSSIPGPSEPVNLLDYPLSLPLFEGGYSSEGIIGIGLSFFSYNGKLGITVNPDEGIIETKENARDLLMSIVNEIQMIYDQSQV